MRPSEPKGRRHRRLSKASTSKLFQRKIPSDCFDAGVARGIFWPTFRLTVLHFERSTALDIRAVIIVSAFGFVEIEKFEPKSMSVCTEKSLLVSYDLPLRIHHAFKKCFLTKTINRIRLPII